MFSKVPDFHCFKIDKKSEKSLLQKKLYDTASHKTSLNYKSGGADETLALVTVVLYTTSVILLHSDESCFDNKAVVLRASVAHVL